jgi:hypothetical protein
MLSSKDVMPNTVPKPVLIVALRDAGLEPPFRRERLQEIIRISVGAPPPPDRSADDLAHAVLNLAKAGMLRVGRKRKSRGTRIRNAT